MAAPVARSPRWGGVQLDLAEIDVEARAVQQGLMARYVEEHHTTYRAMAEAIAPDLTRPAAIWERLAFAILTANTPVDTAVKALALARQYQGLPAPVVRAHRLSITPERAEAVNRLPWLDDALFALCRYPEEPWDEYRWRVVRQVAGLACTKASYAVGLLYPLTAEVACLDTWMCKALGLGRRYVELSPDEYRAAERELAAFGRIVQPPVCVSLTQWMLWDWVRRQGPSPQRYFQW